MRINIVGRGRNKCVNELTSDSSIFNDRLIAQRVGVEGPESLAEVNDRIMRCLAARVRLESFIIHQ